MCPVGLSLAIQIMHLDYFGLEWPKNNPVFSEIVYIEVHTQLHCY